MAASPDGSTEVSPSKTPLNERLNRLSVASTASGMMHFGEEDLEEAQRRWQEEEEAERELAANYCDNQTDDASASTNRMVPSRSSTSLKSILKKSILAAESAGTPQRTVTWSPSTLPAAPSPPEIDVTPEHPRLHARLSVKVQESSPLQHTYVADASLLGSDESREVEEALLSRTSVSPTLSAEASHNESTDSPRLQGSASKRGGGFINRMQAVIPSPESSLAEAVPAQGKPAPEVSYLLDTTEPSRLQDMTVTDEKSRLKLSVGPRPLLLRHSVIVEEPSTMIASPPGSPQSPPQDFHSFASANLSTGVSMPDTPIRAPLHSQENLHRQASQDATYLVGEICPREPPLSEAQPTIEQHLQPLPAITPSSSASSVALQSADSPFSSLISRLISTQDDLLSSRADQKTLLLSLVANLRGELAARERALDTAEQQKVATCSKLRQISQAREGDRVRYETMVQEAVRQMEMTQNALSAEIARRESALREEVLHERTKRELAEGHLEKVRRDGMQVEEVDLLRERLQQVEVSHAALDQEHAILKRDSAEEAAALRADTDRHMQEATRARSDLQSAYAHMETLEEHLAAAEMQITKASARAEERVSALQTQLREALSQSEQLRGQLADTTHALEHERFEQARQSDYTASIQEDLRQERDHLQHSLVQLQKHRETAQQEIVGLKADSTRLLEQRDERIGELEQEVLRQSHERRRQAAETCADCKEAGTRTDFLEKEVIRMREQIAKMRMESADREVKVARLTKARDQLRDDVDGLNIALEAKQQEVHLLKRASVEIPGTVRRTVRSRPSSIHDATGKSTATRVRPDSRRFSAHNASTLETPSVASAVLSSIATNARPTSILGARRPMSRTENRALEAASLVPSNGQEKENIQQVAMKKLTDLPDAPRHALTANLERRQGAVAA